MMPYFAFLLFTVHITLPGALAFPHGSCFVDDEACEIHEDNLLVSVSGVHSVEECRQLCNENEECVYFSYFGQNSFPFSQVCMEFSNCTSLHAAEGCITEDRFCYTTCSDNVEGTLGENIVDILPDIEEELLCKIECNNNSDCNFYTHHNSSDPDYANLCILLAEIQQPLKVCQFCSTGATECSSRKLCGLMFSNGGSEITAASLFTNTSTTVTIHNVSVGRCQLTILGIGGGGSGGFYNSGSSDSGGGGGSGYISMKSFYPGRSSELLVKVGGPEEASTVTTSNGEVIIIVEPGKNGEKYYSGGDGYSGGGGDGHTSAGAGGSDGEDGAPGNQGRGGDGSGLNVSLLILEYFYITPGTGGTYECGGGGGGLLINGTGPSAYNGQGSGYGGGGEGCRSLGVLGAILMETK